MSHRRGRARRLADHPLGAGAPVWSPDSRRLAYVARVPDPGRYGTARCAPEAEPPRLITTLKYRADDRRFHDRPAAPRVRPRPAGRRRRRRRCPARAGQVTAGMWTAATSPGARAGANSRSSPPGARAPTPTWSATSTRSSPTERSAAGHRLPAGTARSRLRPRRRHHLPHAPCPTWAGRARLRRPAGRAVPGPRRRRPAEPLLDPATPRRGDTPATVMADGAALIGVSGAARWSCCGSRWAAARPTPSSTGPSRSAGSASAAGWWWPPWRTTGPPGSWSRSLPAAGG